MWLLPGEGGSQLRDPGVSMPGLLPKICLPFQSLRWPSSPLGWEDTRPQGTPSSAMLDGGAFRPRSLKWEEVLRSCEEGGNISEQGEFGKTSGIVSPPFPEVAADGSPPSGCWEEVQTRRTPGRCVNL